MARAHLGLDGASLELDDVLGRVELERVADGVLWPMRCEVRLPTLEVHPNGAVGYALCDVVATLSHLPTDGSALWLAQSLPQATRYSHVTEQVGHLDLRFHLSSTAFACLEARRDGRPVRIGLNFQASLHRVGSYVRTHDENIPRRLHAHIAIEVARDAWLTALRETRLAQTILLEVPLPDAAPGAYDASLRALAQAHRALEQGGKAGWQACARDVRTAVEKWPGTRARGSIRYEQSMDLHARMAVLREAVLVVTHDAQHQLEDHWHRADALALFAAAASLLSRDVHDGRLPKVPGSAPAAKAVRGKRRRAARSRRVDGGSATGQHSPPGPEVGGARGSS